MKEVAKKLGFSQAMILHGARSKKLSVMPPLTIYGIDLLQGVVDSFLAKAWDMSSHDVVTFDVILILIMLSSGLVGFLRGFVREALSIIVWFGAGFAALYGLRLARVFARDIIPWGWVADVVTVVTIFLIVLVALSMLSRVIMVIVQMPTLFGALDRSLGFLFGLVRGAVVIFLAYFLVISFVPAVDRLTWLQEARSLSLVQYGATLIHSIVPDDLASKVKAVIEAATDRVRQIKEAERTYRHLSNPAPIPILTY